MKKMVWALRIGIIVAGAGLTMEQVQLNRQHKAEQRTVAPVTTITGNEHGKQTADLPVVNVWELAKSLQTLKSSASYRV
ncbi:hypothetical protein [Lactiplantibacillus herbarum]|uniref:hypothetical protein n=1 Tax=Lactiplantibacillus herbarum TaxID=1670446 RepID=UPI00064ECAE2|nr:hypothetical protein [Lactiplantibacillus herbarum]